MQSILLIKVILVVSESGELIDFPVAAENADEKPEMILPNLQPPRILKKANS
jgi:hypothetical protein